MPALIDYIDAIARRQGRAVLYLEFHPLDAWRRYRAADDPARSAVLHWLDEEGIAWQECGPYARPESLEPYLGQVYVDVPYDESLPAYQRLRDHLEHPDGSMRLDGVRFCVISLEAARRNAEHDEPGFWEKVWESF